MRSLVLVAVLLAAQAVSPETDPAARRAAAERFLAERTRSCGVTAAADPAGWPAGEDVAIATDVFFAQPVDDEVMQEQRRAARDMMNGVLQPLGIRAARDEGARAATIAFTGLAEALTPPGAAGANVFSGASWRGTISLHLRGRCVFARAFEHRMQPPPGPYAFAAPSPSDAPFLDGLDLALLDGLIATAEAIRGQAGLARIAASDADSRACLLALARLTDQDMLAGLARTAKASWVRIPAVARLLDGNRLANIARIDPDPEVRQAALARIAELKRKH